MTRSSVRRAAKVAPPSPSKPSGDVASRRDAATARGRYVPASRAARAAWSVGAITVLLLGACGDEPSSALDDAGIPSGEGAAGDDAGSPGNEDRVAEDAGGSDAGARDDDGSPDSGPVACADGTWDHDENPATACVAWSTCVPGTYVTGAPSATADRTCAGCASASFSATNNATICKAWSACTPGSYVSTPGTTIADCQCTDCAAGTYSSSPNQATCVPLGACAAGKEQTEPATPTTPPVCADCEVGTYCAGADTPKQACASGTWDHDSNPATPCVAWTNCLAGQAVAAGGSATTDRKCAACASGSFSTTANAASCTFWTTCMPGSYVSAPGTTIADRQCTACSAGQTTTTTNAAACIGAVELAAGGEHTCARFTDGFVRCWGSNVFGQLGDGTTTEKSSPTAVPGLSLVDKLATGYGHTCARVASVPSSVRCWGSNEFGQLGDGTTTSRRSPTYVPGLIASQVAARANHTCALRPGGSVRCWGLNYSGQLGDTTTAHKSSPTDVTGLSGVVELAAGGSHTCARVTDGSVRCWGNNESGQLGDGTTTNQSSPKTVVQGLSGVAEIAAGGYHTWRASPTAPSAAGEVTRAASSATERPQTNPRPKPSSKASPASPKSPQAATTPARASPTAPFAAGEIT